MLNTDEITGRQHRIDQGVKHRGAGEVTPRCKNKDDLLPVCQVTHTCKKPLHASDTGGQLDQLFPLLGFECTNCGRFINR